MTTVKIDGIEEYRAQIGMLDPKKQRRVWRAIFRATGQSVVQKAARANLRALGHRKHAGKVTTRAKATNRNVEARIGARKRTQLAYIGHLIEGGSRPHVITAGSQRRVRAKRQKVSNVLFRGAASSDGGDVFFRRKAVLASGKNVFGSTVRHPGTVARPWLKPAVDATQQQVADEITTRAAREMEKLRRRD